MRRDVQLACDTMLVEEKIKQFTCNECSKS